MIMASQSAHIFRACDCGLVVLESLWFTSLQLLCFTQSILVNSHCIHWIFVVIYCLELFKLHYILLLIQIGLKGEK